MAPTPDEDSGFPVLHEQILKLLRAMWTFVRDVCRWLWLHISQTFWTVWTYPPFEALRNDLVAALISLKEYVVAHPVAATAIFVLAYIVISVVLDALQLFCLRCGVSRRRGMLRDSYAINYQSTSCGGNVPRTSTFVQYQSQRMKGARSEHRAAGGAGSPRWD